MDLKAEGIILLVVIAAGVSVGHVYTQFRPDDFIGMVAVVFVSATIVSALLRMMGK